MEKDRERWIYRILPVIVIVLQFIIVFTIIGIFQIKDMTLAKGKVEEYNTGWTMIRENGEQSPVQLPYDATSHAGEQVLLQKHIRQEDLGKTLIFLSADKEVIVYVDGEKIYTFGTNDKRLFGHTPGSITNFVDIPRTVTEGVLTIAMTSEYDNYATYMSNMRIANRDVAILQVLKENIGNLACSVILIICGVFLLVFSCMQYAQKKNTYGMYFLGILLIWVAFYYAIETKILHILYGNQTLYSFVIFSFLMCFPILLLLHYIRAENWEDKKSLNILLMVSYGNVFLQIVLQICNLVDFLQMAFMSHILMFVSIICIIGQYSRKVKNGTVKTVWLETMAMCLIGMGSIVDLYRSYTIKVGDLGKYSRFGTVIYAVIMLFLCLKRVIQSMVSETQRQNVILKESEQRAEKANRAKSEFLSNMSHEIRTPLNAVIGMNEMIIREEKEEEVKQYALAAQHSAQALLSLINDILDISKIEAGKIELVENEYEVMSLLVDSYNLIINRLTDKGLVANVNCDKMMPQKLYGDMFRIRQIFVNLLTNAVKYTNEGHIDISLKGYHTPEGFWLQFMVKDTGIGMTKENVAKLFNKFERFDLNRNRNVEGTGLGLSITKELVSLMGGTIDVESEYGKGTCFTVSIPQKIICEEPVGTFELETWKNVKEQEKYERSFTAKNACVLVVDDVDINQKVFRNLLKQTLIQIDTASSGAECLAMAQKKKYDLIFMDYMMPNMSGVETRYKMLADEHSQNKETPMIMLTANTLAGVEEEYKKEGFAGYLSKPIDGEKLEFLTRQMLPEDKIDGAVQSQEKETEMGLEKHVTEQENKEEEGEKIVTNEERITYLKNTIKDMDTEMALAYCAGSVEFYLEMLKSYADSGKTELLQNYYAAKDYENYRIVIHSVKSTSRTLGFTVMGDMAERLEYAIKEENFTYVTENHLAALKYLGQINDAINQSIDL